MDKYEWLYNLTDPVNEAERITFYECLANARKTGGQEAVDKLWIERTGRLPRKSDCLW